MPGISELLDSDMESVDHLDENSILSSASDATESLTNKEKNGTKRSVKKRHRVTMPKSKSKVTKSSPRPVSKAASQKASVAKRKAVENTIKTIAESQQEDTSDHEGMDVEKVSKPKRKLAAKKPSRKVKTLVAQSNDVDVEVEQSPAAAQSSHARAKAAPQVIKIGKATFNQNIAKEPVQDVQPALVDIAMETGEIDEITAQQPPAKRARTESRTRQEQSYRRRAGSASDTERGDPNLRRKLGDVTRKFENIDMKYRNLKEIGISEANANVEKLRKQCEATTEASNSLIASMKKELAQQTPLVQDARKLKLELQARDEELTKLRVSQAEISASLVSAQNEIKALQAKLAAARTASVEPPPTKTPGSAMKTARATAMTNLEASQAVQVAQMKLDLYGDLTGLIIRSVKRSEDGDTYDCIQTGRNGTLHFKLFIDQEEAKSASFEETEFLYTPLLDHSRDHDMIELMPQYLTEDITFARQNAAKFYQRVVDTLTRRTNET